MQRSKMVFWLEPRNRQNVSNNLPFSRTASGPPESPWHESLPWPPAQIWNLHKFFLWSIIIWSPLLVLLFNFSRVVIIALVIGLHKHIHLLECWCWTAISSCVPPASHCGHLASVQGGNRGRETDWSSFGGEVDGGGQGQYREIIVSIVMVKSRMACNLGHIVDISYRVWGVMLSNQHLDGGWGLDILNASIIGTVGCC